MAEKRVVFQKDPPLRGVDKGLRLFPKVRIVLDGKEIGFLDPPSYVRSKASPGCARWQVWFAVRVKKFEAISPRLCGWEWVSAPNSFVSLREARDWFLNNLELLQRKFKFHSFGKG